MSVARPDRGPRLIDPTVRLRASFLAAVAEYRADRGHAVPWFAADVDPAPRRGPTPG